MFLILSTTRIATSSYTKNMTPVVLFRLPLVRGMYIRLEDRPPNKIFRIRTLNKFLYC